MSQREETVGRPYVVTCDGTKLPEMFLTLQKVLCFAMFFLRVVSNASILC